MLHRKSLTLSEWSLFSVSRGSVLWNLICDLIVEANRDPSFKFTKTELAQFLRALTTHKREIDLELTAANEFMARVFNGPSDYSCDCTISSGLPANQGDKQHETTSSCASTPGGEIITNHSWGDSPTVLESHSSSFEQHPTSSSFFLEELQCITAVSSENEILQEPSAS